MNIILAFFVQLQANFPPITAKLLSNHPFEYRNDAFAFHLRDACCTETRLGRVDTSDVRARTC